MPQQLYLINSRWCALGSSEDLIRAKRYGNGISEWPDFFISHREKTNSTKMILEPAYETFVVHLLKMMHYFVHFQYVWVQGEDWGISIPLLLPLYKIVLTTSWYRLMFIFQERFKKLILMYVPSQSCQDCSVLYFHFFDRAEMLSSIVRYII